MATVAVDGSTGHLVEEVPQARVLEDGRWEPLHQDPVMSLAAAAEDWEAAMREAGFHLWCGTPEDDTESWVPLKLRVYRRVSEPRFLVDLEGVFESEWAYAATLPDVMGLLGQWAPVVQALVMTGVLAQADAENRGRPVGLGLGRQVRR
ncbi:hypothetical protein GCM10010441_40050 [Kitasatospora paracochleata]